DVPPWMTQPSVVMGTPAYMAPEQMRGDRVDARADQYAFCVALYEALHGHRPSRGRSETEVDGPHPRTQPMAAVLADRSGPIPEAVEAVLVRGLAPDPADRFPTLDGLMDALVEAQQRRERDERVELERKAQAMDSQPRSQLRRRHSLF